MAKADAEEEPKYTLKQAKRILRRQQCAQSGQHHLVPVGGSIDRVHCSACDRDFDLKPVPEEDEVPTP